MQSRDATAFVLVVDDEPVIVSLIQAVLGRMGHCVVAAKSSKEAFQAASRMETVDALIVDHRVSADWGRDIAELLLLSHPEMRVMHISGFSGAQLEEEGQLTPGAAFLSKPFTALQLRNAMTALLNF